MTPSRSVTLRSVHDADGLRNLTATIRDNGDLVIEGHDLGPGVARALRGAGSEYEWATTVASADLTDLLAALGRPPDTDVLEAVADFAGADAHLVEQRVREHGVPHHFWSRIGD